MSDTSPTAVVTGASRGFGRAIAAVLVAAGHTVIGIARGEEDLRAARAELGDAFTPIVAAATDEGLAHDVLHEHRPGLVVLNAGSSPHMAPIHEQTGDTFSGNRRSDTRHAFTWIRAALREPLAPGSAVIAMSSGATLAGSPLSGGYASAKAAVRYLRGYAADEAQRAGLDIRFVALLPQLAPAGGVGAVGVAVPPPARLRTPTVTSHPVDGVRSDTKGCEVAPRVASTCGRLASTPWWCGVSRG